MSAPPEADRLLEGVARQRDRRAARQLVGIARETIDGRADAVDGGIDTG
jgi:hypothetical protein